MQYISKQALGDMINLDRVNDRHHAKMHAIVTRCISFLPIYDWRLDVDKNDWLEDNKEYFDYIFWRWEFLRRNNFYRLTWIYYSTIFTASFWEKNPNRLTSFNQFVTDVFGLRNICDPRFNFDEHDMLLSPGAYRYFGLSEDIIHNWPEFTDQNANDLVIRDLSTLEKLHQSNVNLAFVPIDLSLSINLQLSRAKPHLDAIKIRPPKQKLARKNKPLSIRNPEYWPLYAKVLDAHDIGWTHKKIVELLASRKREFVEGAGRDAWEAADRVRRDFRSVT